MGHRASHTLVLIQLLFVFIISDITMKDIDKFVFACGDKHIDTVREMINNGWDVNEGDSFGYTGLIVAMSCKHPAIVTMLLAHPDIDLGKSSRDYKNTALHCGCRNNNVECVELFLRHPKCTSDIVTSRNSGGKTAEMIATEEGNHECARLVRDYLTTNNTTRGLSGGQTQTQASDTAVEMEKTKQVSLEELSVLQLVTLSAALQMKLNESLDKQHGQKSSADLLELKRKIVEIQVELRKKENSQPALPL